MTILASFGEPLNITNHVTTAYLSRNKKRLSKGGGGGVVLVTNLDS